MERQRPLPPHPHSPYPLPVAKSITAGPGARPTVTLFWEKRAVHEAAPGGAAPGAWG
jgi:hypothetical protein